MKTFIFLFVIFTLSITPALAQKKVAVVKLIRGDVDLLTLGKTAKLEVNQWVEEGAVVKTSEKSFVKLIFIDKSQMNIGPHSEMKIESFSGKDSGVIDLVKGKIRSQVTKDYLQMDDKNKSKLFIKTANAVMGVRGTDFMITSNGVNSSVVLFEGEVVFNKLEDRQISDSSKLEDIVDSGVKMYPGEFSVVEQNRQPTVPALLNVSQRESLEKSDSVDSRAPSNTNKNDSVKSVVPGGLNGNIVSNDASALKNEVAKISDQGGERQTAASSNPDGFIQGDKIKPANGSFLHVESGTIIPPASNSLLDKNTNTYVGTGNGTSDSKGNYVPPPNIVIKDNGDMFKVVEPPPATTAGVQPAPGTQPTSRTPPTSGTPLEPLKPVAPLDLGGPTVIRVPVPQVDQIAPAPDPKMGIAPAQFTTSGTMSSPMPVRAPTATPDLRLQNQVENNAPTANTTINVRHKP